MRCLSSKVLLCLKINVCRFDLLTSGIQVFCTTIIFMFMFMFLTLFLDLLKILSGESALHSQWLMKLHVILVNLVEPLISWLIIEVIQIQIAQEVTIRIASLIERVQYALVRYVFELVLRALKHLENTLILYWHYINQSLSISDL